MFKTPNFKMTASTFAPNFGRLGIWNGFSTLHTTVITKPYLQRPQEDSAPT